MTGPDGNYAGHSQSGGAGVIVYRWSPSKGHGRGAANRDTAITQGDAESGVAPNLTNLTNLTCTATSSWLWYRAARLVCRC